MLDRDYDPAKDENFQPGDYVRWMDTNDSGDGRTSSFSNLEGPFIVLSWEQYPSNRPGYVIYVTPVGDIDHAMRTCGFDPRWFVRDQFLTEVAKSKK